MNGQKAVSATSTDPMICERGGHVWQRPRVRGQRPRYCPKHRATRDRDDRIVAAYRDGAGAPAIAAKFQVSHKTVYKVLRAQGVTPRGRKPRLDGRCSADPNCTAALVARQMCGKHLRRAQRNGDPTHQTLACSYGHTWTRTLVEGQRTPRNPVCPEHRRQERAEARTRAAANRARIETRRDQVVECYQTARSAYQVAALLDLHPELVYRDLRERGYEIYRDMICAFDGHEWTTSSTSNAYYCPEHRNEDQPGLRQIAGQHLGSIGATLQVRR